jgi:hypothetical protein
VRTQRPTAGQASTEYIATIALIAVMLVLAAPAVGAPSIASAVIRQLERALCIAGLDICDAQMAADAGLAPCPLRAELTGHELSVTVLSIDVGNRSTLTVSERSDGSVTVVRTAGEHAGVAGGVGAGVTAGPVEVGVGAEGSARLRVRAARGWDFPNRASADRFLERALLNSFDEDDFPASWNSFEAGNELVGSVGAALGDKDGSSVGAATASASAGHALGGRIGRGGSVTLYGRVGVEGEASLPFVPAVGPGRLELMVEYTVDRGGPRELAFRTTVPQNLTGTRIEDTTYRLDLREPGNLAVARALVDAAWPWPPHLVDAIGPVFDRIGSHGAIERIVSEVDDEGWGAEAEGSLGVKVGAGYKRIRVNRALVSASARAGGFERRRLDCQVPSK